MKQYQYITDKFEKARWLAIEASKFGASIKLTPFDNGYRVISNQCLNHIVGSFKEGADYYDNFSKGIVKHPAPDIKVDPKFQTEVRATIFKLGTSFSRYNNNEVIDELSTTLINLFPDKYSKAFGFGRIVQLESPEKYPADKSKIIYPVLKGSILRVGKEHCIEVSVASSSRPDTAIGSSDSDFETWWIRNSSRPWREQINLVKEFISDIGQAGVQLELAGAASYKAEHVRIKNSQGVQTYSGGSLSKISSHPLQTNQNYSFVVFGSYKFSGANFIATLQTKLQYALKGVSFDLREVSDEYEVLPFEAAIIISSRGASCANAERQHIENLIIRLEKKGARFKELPIDVATDATKMSNFAQNLLQTLGFSPWRVEFAERKIIATLDGGHLSDSRRSRWALSIYDTQSGLLEIRHVDCALQEHITEAVLKELFGDLKSIDEVWRDGRWHSVDRHWVSERFPNAKLVEIAKNPNAIMFRGSIDNPERPHYGDAVKLKDGRCYIQSSIESNRYPGPLRIRGADKDSDINQLVALCAMPSLARFKTARLPAPLYWSDLASKLSVGKKGRAQGFGWRLT